jgi:hypothetical protein
MDSSEVVDLVVFLACMGLFFLYHVWYFLRGRWGSTNIWCWGHRAHVDLWSTSVKTRGMWAVAMMTGEAWECQVEGGS